MQRRTPPATFRHITREIFGALVLALVAIVVAMAIESSPVASAATESVEVKFADNSKSGLAIIPASCPSSPHYVGECSPVIPACVAYAGQVCTTSSVCGTLTGSYACDGTCNVGQEGGRGFLGSKACPTCAENMGAACTSAPNVCGMTGSGAIQCNGTCAAVVPSNSLCSSPPRDSGVSCVANAGSACSSAPNSCGMTSPGTILCSGACSSSAPSNNLCSITCWDGSIVGAGGTCPSCPTGYTQSGNSCIPPSGPQFVGFTTTQGFNASGHLEVRPSLVRSGDTTVVYWNVTNVRDCTVRGSNGDGASGSLTGAWDSLGSGASGMTTSPITSRTDYTLFCRSLVGATPSTISETRTVNVIPQWYEPSGE